MIYWHVLLQADPEAREVAVEAQEVLGDFSGLHMTPLNHLHITTLVAGTTDEISRDQMADMLSTAQRLLGDKEAIPVKLSKVFYHPEAIVFPVYPVEALRPLFVAAQSATRATVEQDEAAEDEPQLWVPHMTVAYSEAEQPMAPIVSTLGRSMRQRRVLVNALSLVIQWGPERLWNWEQVGSVSLRGPGHATRQATGTQ